MKKSIPVCLILILCCKCLAADPSNGQPTPQELARQIITAFQSGQRGQIQSNLTADVSILEKGVKDSPGDYLLHFALATCDMVQNDKTAALTHLEKAYTLSQQDPGIGMLYALALKMDKQPLKAYELDKEMVARHPELPQLQISLATLDMTIQKYDEAITIVEALQQKAPANLAPKDRSALLVLLGTCQLYSGNHAEAIASLQSALKLTPRMAPASAILGEAYFKTGDLPKAGANLDAALAINPKYPPALFYKGLCLEKTGEMEIAQKYFQSAYENGKAYLSDNGENYYLMYLISQKISKNEEGLNYKTEAARLLYSHEAPWRQ